MNAPSTLCAPLPALRSLIDCLADLTVYGVAPEAALPRPHMPRVAESPLTERDGGFARYSAPLRNFVVQSGIMVTHPYLVGLLASAKGSRCHLRPMLDPDGFLGHFPRALARDVTRQIARNRTQRRALLNDTDGLSDLALDRRILGEIILPRVTQAVCTYLERPVDLSAPASALPDFCLPEVRISDPLPRNLVMLALRRSYFGRSASGHTSVFRLSPFSFARVLNRRDQMGEADFAAALASVQVTLLTVHSARLR